MHHQLDISLDPAASHIEVRDTVTLPPGAPRVLDFALHPHLEAQLTDPEGQLEELPAGTESGASQSAAELRPRRYRLRLPAGTQHFTLRYAGRIAHPLQQQGEEYARSFEQTRGVISSEGVFLAGSSYWYPQFANELMTFDLRVQLPAEWRGMSQGQRVNQTTKENERNEHWRCTTPQQEIYLIAGAFSEYTSSAGGILAQVLLRHPEPELAQTYLDATQRYIKLYSELIGPYPFEKFALVENFWQSGYGMPSFTLLGSQVIRFPFILGSSYPHEILHNWWGNSVYVDYASGNWAEGLTSYLADHLIKEQRGEGAEYRRTLLQKYADYVDADRDFPLTEFRGRHSARTQAVGYGKTLMLFHMLRRQLGDTTFLEGLQAFYHQHRFRVAGFADLEDTYSKVAEQSTDAFFAQWVERSGAPELRISDAQINDTGDGYRLSAIVEQIQSGAAYRLELPVAVQLENRAGAWQTDVQITQRRQRLELDLPTRPLRLDIDPEFDIFRRLHRSEIPPAVSQAMGADRVLLVLPAEAARAMQRAYRTLAESWRDNRPEQVSIAFDNSLEQLPEQGAVWLFGWRNRFRPQLQAALQEQNFSVTSDSVRIEQTRLDAGRHSVVVLARHPAQPEQAFGWLAASDAAAVPGLGRKLPHYGRYSYLAFTGDAPDNILKGQWPVLNSPLSIRFAEGHVDAASAPAQLAPRPPLVKE
ncbi:MAG: M1 family aminopeptidase [Thiogranum sp.]|nr:M1 family aminopeptidase [Thiogranum sp.]